MMRPERRISTAPLTLEVVRETAQLAQLRPEWSKFVNSLEEINPFQTPEWQFTWWSHFGVGDLYVMVFRSVDAIVGIVPCFLLERQMMLLGTGIADYLEPPISPRHRGEVLALLRNHLSANSKWDLCSWRDLAATTPLRTLTFGDQYEAKLFQDVECTELAITGEFANFWETRPFGLRRNVRRYVDKATFSVVAQADPEYLNVLIRLHGERWERRGEVGMSAVNGVAAFLWDLARAMDNADMLRIFTLRFEGKVVAVTLAFVLRNTIYSFLSVHDAEFEVFGFGRSLLFDTLQHAFEQGYKAWNFLRGNEPYKFLWGAQSIPKIQLLVTRK
jgi:CelD/BcsL family acetyltransferase involved in cellulose biosynthesis